MGWYYNKSVQLVSNYRGKDPMSECKRWCRKEKIFINIPRPLIVECCNKHMEGIELADMLLQLINGICAVYKFFCSL